MKSVGEVMSIGRTFCEALQKAARSLETGKDGLVSLLDARRLPRARGAQAARAISAMEAPESRARRRSLAAARRAAEIARARSRSSWRRPTADRLFYVADAMRVGRDRRGALRAHGDRPLVSRADPPHRRRRRRPRWRARPRPSAIRALQAPRLQRPRRSPRSRGASEDDVRARSASASGVRAVYARVDTCAAEFVAHTPYLYSTYETESESRRRRGASRKVVILGGGPNRIGQGIEFDYCCVHAVQALRELGFETIMVNCNPETVSTDYDTSRPPLLRAAHARGRARHRATRRSPIGVIVQFGGQTPLKLARAAREARRAAARDDGRRHRPRRGPRALRRAAHEARAQAPAQRDRARRSSEALADRRPHRLPGARPAELRARRARDDDRLLARGARQSSSHRAFEAARDAGHADRSWSTSSSRTRSRSTSTASADGKRCVIGGVMQHIEEAGIHSGDSLERAAAALAAARDRALASRSRRGMLALELGVVGLMNVQFAVKGGEVYILEVNPRASRTVPFVSKATGRPLAKIAAMLMVGKTLDELGFDDVAVPRAHVR